MSVHPDMTALRAVDACGGIYTPAEEASGFSIGHRAALRSAMDAVASADGLTEELLGALDGLVRIIDAAGLGNLVRGVQLGQTSWYVKASDKIAAAERAIAKATGSEASA